MTKIGFFGTGGTGKTTTDALIKNYLKVPYHPSVPREVFTELGITEGQQRHMSNGDRWALQKAIFDRKIKQDQDYPEGLFDRTLIDHMAYCLFRCDQSMTDSVTKSMMLLLAENMQSYSKVFYFPLYAWEVPDDGMRENSFAYRLVTDRIMEGLAIEAEVSYIKVPEGNKETRAQFVLNHIQGS